MSMDRAVRDTIFTLLCTTEKQRSHVSSNQNSLENQFNFFKKKSRNIDDVNYGRSFDIKV